MPHLKCGMVSNNNLAQIDFAKSGMNIYGVAGDIPSRFVFHLRSQNVTM